MPIKGRIPDGTRDAHEGTGDDAGERELPPTSGPPISALTSRASQPPASGTFTDYLRGALASTEAEERRQATSELPRARLDEVLPLLEAALGDADWRVRKEATMAARAFGPEPALLTGLTRLLVDVEDVGQRNAIVDVLAALGAPAIAAIAEVFERVDADARKLFVDALAKSGSASALDVLDRALDDADENVRAAAMEAIAGLGAVAPERVAETLLARVHHLDERNPVPLVAALDGLTALGIAAPWPRLAPLLDVPILRPAALAAAALIERVEVASAVSIVLLEASAGLERGGVEARTSSVSFAAAVRALGKLATAELSPDIRRVLRSAGSELGRHLVAAALPATTRPLAFADEAGVSLRAMALRLAALSGAPGVVDAAVTALGDHLLANEAQRALVLLGPDGLPAVLTRVADEAVPADVRGALVDVAVTVLESSSSMSDAPDTSSMTALRAGARDPEPAVAVRSLRGLGRLGGEADLALVAAETLAPSRVVSGAAEAALLLLASRHADAARALVDRLVPDASRALPTAILIRGSAEDARSGAVDDRRTTFLAHAVTSGEPSARRAAVEAVSALRAVSGAGYPAAFEVLGFALTDEEHEVQLAAARALGRLCSAANAPRATDVFDLVQRSGAPELLAAAVRAIGEEGSLASGLSPEVVAALSSFAARAPSQVALAAIETLANAHRAGRATSATSVTSVTNDERADLAFAGLAGAVEHADEAVVKAALLKLSAEAPELRETSETTGPAEHGRAAERAFTKALGHASPAIRALGAEGLAALARGEERG